jgi:hypothetical protein
MTRPPVPSAASRIRFKSSHRRVCLKTSHRRFGDASGFARDEERDRYIPPKRPRR